MLIINLQIVLILLVSFLFHLFINLWYLSISSRNFMSHLLFLP